MRYLNAHFGRKEQIKPSVCACSNIFFYQGGLLFCVKNTNKNYFKTRLHASYSTFNKFAKCLNIKMIKRMDSLKYLENIPVFVITGESLCQSS